MSNDVAALGLSVDSSQVTKGTAALDGLANSAAKAEAAANDFNTGASAAATSASKISPAATAAARAMEGQAGAATNAARAMAGASVAAQRLAANQNVLRAQTGNIAAQFQDIAVQLQAGQSPFVIALQQGTQLSAVLGSTGGGLRGILGSLGAAFASLLSPVSLLTIGLIAGGAALIQYFTGASNEAEKTNAALKAHNSLIKGAADEWGAATPALQAYNKELEHTERLQKLIAAEQASAGDQWVIAENASQRLNDEVSKGLAFIRQYGDASALSGLIDDYNVLKQAIADHNVTAAQAKQFEDELSKALADTGNKGAMPLIAALERVIATIDQARSKAKQFNDEAASNTYSAPINVPDRMAGLRPNFVPRSDQQLPTPSLFYRNTPDGLQPANDDAKAATGNADAAASAYSKVVKAAQDQVDAMKAQAQTMGLSGVAAEALKFKLDLLNKAFEAGQEPTKQQTERINELTAAYQAAAQAAAQAKFNADLAYQNRQMGRSTQDQQIADRLRGYGLEDDLSSPYANALRQQAMQKEAYDAADAFSSNLADNLVNSGGHIGEALAKTILTSLQAAASKELSNIFSSLLHAALQSLFGGASPVSAPASGVMGAAGHLAGAVVNGVRPDVVNGAVVNSPVNNAAATVTKLLPAANQNNPLAYASPTDNGPIATSVVNAGRGFTTFQMNDGSIIRRDGTFAWRNNNPGNIESGAFAANQPGYLPNGGRFAAFDTVQHGLDARQNLLFNSPAYRNRSLSDAIYRYAPPSENNTEGYIRSLTDASGVDRNTLMRDITPSQQQAILAAQMRVEGNNVGRETVLRPSPFGQDGIDLQTTNSVNESLTRLSTTTTATSTNLASLSNSSQSLSSSFTSLLGNVGQGSGAGSGGGLFSWLGGLFGGGPSVGSGVAPAAPSLARAAAPAAPASSKAQSFHVTVGLQKRGLNITPEVVSIARSESGKAAEPVARRVVGQQLHDQDDRMRRGGLGRLQERYNKQKN